MAQRTIVLVGRRRAAAEAARRIGLEPLEVVIAARQEQARGAYGGSSPDAVAAVHEHLLETPPAAVLAVAEGAVPAAAALRAEYGLPGLSVDAALRCHDKLVMKRAIAGHGVRCAPWAEVTDETTADALAEQLGLPLVLKVPVSSGGRGVVIAHTRDQVAAAMAPGMLAEGFVAGIELSVETLLADGEVIFRNPTRYLRPRWANVVPAALSDAVRADIDAVLEGAHAALGVDSGITHAELFVTESGAVFGEIAARPPGGHIMELIRLAYGFDPWEAVIRIALGEHPVLPARAGQHAAVHMLHPGPGTVVGIHGRDEARAHPGVERVRVSVKIDEVVPPRMGVGQTTGEVVVVAPTHDGCAAAVEHAAGLIRIDMAPPS